MSFDISRQLQALFPKFETAAMENIDLICMFEWKWTQTCSKEKLSNETMPCKAAISQTMRYCVKHLTFGATKDSQPQNVAALIEVDRRVQQPAERADCLDVEMNKLI